MTATVTKRVGGWVLEWDPARPGGVWAIPRHLRRATRADRGVMYETGAMGWDWPDRTPAYVRDAAPSFLARCQGNHNNAERGNQ